MISLAFLRVTQTKTKKGDLTDSIGSINAPEALQSAQPCLWLYFWPKSSTTGLWYAPSHV